LAIASILGDRTFKREAAKGGNTIGPLRGNMEPVEFHVGKGAWQWTERNPSVVWSSGPIWHNLAKVLERRLLDAERSGSLGVPLEALRTVGLEDVARFVRGEVDFRRIEELLWGAILIDQTQEWPVLRANRGPCLPLPNMYALLKLLFLPHVLALKSARDGKAIRSEPSILVSLRAGNTDMASAIATRRLRASGVIPMPGRLPGRHHRNPHFEEKIDPRLLAAALIIPIDDVYGLTRRVLLQTYEKSQS
jgi:CRISPR-associated protein Csx17